MLKAVPVAFWGIRKLHKGLQLLGVTLRQGLGASMRDVLMGEIIRYV